MFLIGISFSIQVNASAKQYLTLHRDRFITAIVIYVPFVGTRRILRKEQGEKQLLRAFAKSLKVNPQPTFLPQCE